MSTGLPYRHGIPGNEIPNPFESGLPSGRAAMGHVQTFARHPVMADMSTTQNNYHLAQSEWTTTVRLSMAPWEEGLDYEEYVSPGDLIFISAGKERPVVAFDSEEMHVLNVQCFQDITKRLYHNAMNRIAPYLNNPDGVSDTGDADRIKEYGKYLRLPETSMLELFAPGSELNSKQDAAWAMKFLCMHGITDSFRPFGVVMTDPSVVYDASRRVRHPNPLRAGRKDISVATSGTVDMYNYWPGAKHLDYLFMVITRNYNRDKNDYDTFCAKFVHRDSKELSPHGQMYPGVFSELPERAAIWYIGQKTDDKGASPDENSTPVVQGLRGSVKDSVNAMRSFPKIRVLLAPAVRRT